MHDKESSSLIKHESEPAIGYGTTTKTSSSAASSHHSSVSTAPDDECAPFPTEQLRSTLSFIQKIGFGLGHVYNDLCAGVWFSYTLLFMQGALKMASAEAGALVMLGQIGDALATPIVGIMADRFGTKRKWHIAGNF